MRWTKWPARATCPKQRPGARSRRWQATASEADIAGVIGISPKTLRKHYRDELKLGHVKANVKVAENLYRKATGEGREAVVAAIFWLKTRAGWKETMAHEVSGGSAPLKITRIILTPGDPVGRALPSKLVPMVIDHDPHGEGR